VQGLSAFKKVAQTYATANPQAGLLVAKGSSYTMFSESEPITRNQLDEAIPDRPFIMVAYDHHTAWANTIALEKAGVLNGRDVGVGNEIVMGDDGLATGELRETKAMRPVMALRTDGGREGYGMKGTEPQPGPSSAERRDDREVLEAGLRYCAELGITSIHNMDGNLYQLELLDEIRRAGELRCRKDSIGRLETGLLADVVVLSDDIEETAPGELGEVRPVVTICDGQITYEA